MAASALRLFEAIGIEIEYAIVDDTSLAVAPLAVELLSDAGTVDEGEVDRGGYAWSNELALHVVELKTNGPSPSLRGLADGFQEQVVQANRLLAPRGARLMPTAMHPWMDPERELRLWPFDNDEIYRTFDRVFDCRGHGWANLQSMHVNLPFGDDDELGRLHAAIRIALPILPALAASSPVCDGRPTGTMDTRMHVYRTNSRLVPSVSGEIIPEAVFTRADYRDRILQRIFDDLAPLDPDGTISHEWVNSRGCIARFDRDAIEIRVLDTQERPRADIAIAGAVTSAIRALVEERVASQPSQRAWHERALAEILQECVASGDRALIHPPDYLRLFGYPDRAPALAGDLWAHIVESQVARDPDFAQWSGPLATILRRGCLARRIDAALGTSPSRAQLAEVYRELCDCLHEDRAFDPDM